MTDCHDHHHHTPLTPDELARLKKQQRALKEFKAAMQRMQKLHDKIDSALAKVTPENIGYLLTQKKTLRELRREAAALFASGFSHPMLTAMEKAEKEYIENIESILHDAQILRRASRGSVTPEVMHNLETRLAEEQNPEK